jgi:hypothetical protein
VEEPPIEEPPVEEPPVSLPEDEVTSEEPVVAEAAVNGYPSADEPEEEEPEAEEEPDAIWEPEPVDEEPEPEPTADDQPTVELRAVRFSREPPQLPGPQRVTITEVVDDLLAPAASSEEVVDASVVDQPATPAPSPQDARLVESVRDALAAHPGLLPGTVEIEVVGGMVRLHGWVPGLDVAGQIERVVTAVHGVQGVQSFLRLHGS